MYHILAVTKSLNEMTYRSGFGMESSSNRREIATTLAFINSRYNSIRIDGKDNKGFCFDQPAQTLAFLSVVSPVSPRPLLRDLVISHQRANAGV
jgi:hypothetical protein